MSSKVLLTVLGTFLIVGTWCAAGFADKPEPQPISGKINWVFDYEDGQRLSRETGKPMFVVFRCER